MKTLLFAFLWLLFCITVAVVGKRLEPRDGVSPNRPRAMGESLVWRMPVTAQPTVIIRHETLNDL